MAWRHCLGQQAGRGRNQWIDRHIDRSWRVLYTGATLRIPAREDGPCDGYPRHSRCSACWCYPPGWAPFLAAINALYRAHDAGDVRIVATSLGRFVWEQRVERLAVNRSLGRGAFTVRLPSGFPRFRLDRGLWASIKAWGQSRRVQA